ncbi:hypothetical protein JCM10908_005132 [Rhodotorula pacifica]|uniref:ribonuclease III domain-containing protein n=1 Tax=Rhodotorula pacifica TaxID=1495444 RepID=UPI00316C885D
MGRCRPSKSARAKARSSEHAHDSSAKANIRRVPRAEQATLRSCSTDTSDTDTTDSASSDTDSSTDEVGESGSRSTTLASSEDEVDEAPSSSDDEDDRDDASSSSDDGTSSCGDDATSSSDDDDDGEAEGSDEERLPVDLEACLFFGPPSSDLLSGPLNGLKDRWGPKLCWAQLPELPPPPTEWWTYDHSEVRWIATGEELRYYARLGDARLEYLVPRMLQCIYKRDDLPQVAVQYLQRNKTLGALAFAFGFRDHRSKRLARGQLHHYADMLEAYVETIFSTDPQAGERWLEALWSPSTLVGLDEIINEHKGTKRGVPTPYNNLDLARKRWRTKQMAALKWGNT